MISLTTFAFIFLLSVVIGIEVAVPYTKVEESFNVQASHDLMAWKNELHRFDHNEFPGVVPRSFLGSAVLAAMASPFSALYDAIVGSTQRDKMFEQHAIRGILSILTCTSVYLLAKALPIPDPSAHKAAAAALMVMTAVTYHIAFYASRTLPNTFALAIVNTSVALLLQQRVRCGFALLAAGAAIFRSDILVLIVPLALVHVFINRSLGLISGAAVGAFGAAVALALTIPIDSYLWGWLLWPEAVVLRFNTVENRSSEWGVSPMHWYFTSAIPKAFLLLTPAIFLAPFLSKYCRKEFVSAIVFVLLYSLLAHKEVRFIMIVFPVLLCPLACYIGVLWSSVQQKRSAIRILFLVAIAGLIVIQLGVVAFQAYASSLNYPGALALGRVHALAAKSQSSPKGNRSVYIDAYAGMTGVTRFVKKVSAPHDSWTYNKDPNLFNKTAGVYESRKTFDYLIVRHEDKEWHRDRGIYHWVEDIGTVSAVRFTRLAVEMKPFLSIFQHTKPRIDDKKRHEKASH